MSKFVVQFSFLAVNFLAKAKKVSVYWYWEKKKGKNDLISFAGRKKRT